MPKPKPSSHTMEEQIQMNILADDTVCEAFEKAIRYLLYKVHSEPDAGATEAFAAALERIKIIDGQDPAISPISTTPATSAQQRPRLVTFDSTEIYIKLPETPEPKTPAASNRLTFSFSEEQDEPEITYL